MFRTKWMIIHGLNPNKSYALDLYIKEMAAKICLPEDFIWQTSYEAALHNKSRLYLSFFHRALTWAFKRAVGEKDFEKRLDAANEKLDKIREEIQGSMLRIVNLGEDEDRSKSN